jgi:hypothetical protein
MANHPQYLSPERVVRDLKSCLVECPDQGGCGGTGVRGVRLGGQIVVEDPCSCCGGAGIVYSGDRLRELLTGKAVA